MRKLMQRAQEMQAQVKRAQQEVAGQTFEATSGGGVVKATVSGEGTVVAVEFDPSILDPDDPELVGDLVVAAVNQALESAQQAMVEAVGGGMGLDADGLDGLIG